MLANILSKNNKFKLIIAVSALFVLAFLSEAVHALSHRDVLSSYLLRSAKYASAKGNASLAIFILSEGRARLSVDDSFGDKVKNYLLTANPKYDLARVNYGLAVLASKFNSPSIIPQLLDVSLERDPDFSFWRVELANYFLGIRATETAEMVLNDCIELSAPSKHCLDYKNGDFVNKTIHPIGFLEEEINSIYQTKSF